MDPTIEIVASICAAQSLTDLWSGNDKTTAFELCGLLRMRFTEVRRNAHVAKTECQTIACRLPSNKSCSTPIEPRMTPSVIPIKVKSQDKCVVNLRKMQYLWVGKSQNSKIL
jgi:hypothetical protein